VKELDARLHQVEAMVAALKVKLDALEALTIPRPVFRKNRDKVDKEQSWAQPTTR
jgi:hypothetical protein